MNLEKIESLKNVETRENGIKFVPYSAEYWVRELQHCLFPLLKMEYITEDLAEEIDVLYNTCIHNDIDCQENPINRHTFNLIEDNNCIELINNIIDRVIEIIGQLILIQYPHYLSIIQGLVQIYINLFRLGEINSEIWGYYENTIDVKFGNEYNNTFNIVHKTFYNFHELLQRFLNNYNYNYENRKYDFADYIEHENCENKNDYISNKYLENELIINKDELYDVKEIYIHLQNYYLELVSITEKTPPYIERSILEELSKKLISMAGALYIEHYICGGRNVIKGLIYSIKELLNKLKNNFLLQINDNKMKEETESLYKKLEKQFYDFISKLENLYL